MSDAVIASSMWQPLRAGDADPFSISDENAWCGTLDPIDSEFCCSRPAGHDGLHVACYGAYGGWGEVCCDSWGADPNLALPEGF